MINLPQSF